MEGRLWLSPALYRLGFEKTCFSVERRGQGCCWHSTVILSHSEAEGLYLRRSHALRVTEGFPRLGPRR